MCVYIEECAEGVPRPCLIKGWDGAKRDDVKSIAFIPEDRQTSNYAISA
jgi:hypothetical protein